MTEHETLRSTIGKMSQAIEKILNNGERAELRRISPHKPYSAALWKLLVHLDLDEAVSAHDEESWALIAKVLAENVGAYDPKERLGKVLAENGWSELRFTQLLEARDSQLSAQIRRVSQFLASKGARCDWSELARILLVQDGEAAETYRKSVARSYFTQLYKSEKN